MLPRRWNVFVRLVKAARDGAASLARMRPAAGEGSHSDRSVVADRFKLGWARPAYITGMRMGDGRPKAPVDPKVGAGKRQADQSLDAGFDRFIERQLTRMYGHVLNEPLPEDIERLLSRVPSGKPPDDRGSGS